MRSILDYIKVFKNIETYKKPRSTIQEPRNMELAKASDIPDAFDPDLEQSEFLRPGETLEDWKPNPFLKPHAEGGRIGYDDGQLVQNTADGSRPGYGGPGGGKPGRSFKIIDKELLETIVNEANLSDKWHSEEDIAKLYAEATGDTNVTKRKVKDKTVTYKKLDSPTIKNAGGLISKEQKIQNVFNDLLAMDGPVPEVDLRKYKDRNISNYKKYIMSKTGLGTTFVDQTVNKLPTFKKHKKAFKYLWTSGLAKTDLANMSLTEQLNWAIDAGKGKPVFTGVSKLNIEDPTFTLMRIAKENWNKNKGAGNIQFYDKNGKITWKHGLKMNINNVSFSKDKSKKRFTLGDKKGAINVRLEGEKYFPEVFENQRYINELKSTWVDNPFKPGKQIEFGKLMRKVYMQGHGWKPHAPFFSIFHGPEGITKEPFKNLSFGMQDLNRALYHMDNIPLKGLKQKVIDQALVGLKGKKGEKLLEAIVAKHSEHASQVAAGKKFDRPLRIQVLEEVAKTGDLGPKETKVVANILAGWCSSGAQRVGKDEGGRIGFGGCPDGEKITNMKNAAAKLKQHDRYLRGLSDTTPFADNAAAKALASKMAKSGGLLRRAGRLAIGPMTLWGEPLFEGAFVAHDILGTGTPWKEAVAKSLWAKPAIAMGLLKPADQQYDEALWQVRDEEGRALLKKDQTMAAPGAPMELRTRTGVKRFIDNNKKLDELNRLFAIKQGVRGAGRLSPDKVARNKATADKNYKDYLESLGGAEGVRDIKIQIENDRESYDDRVAALEIERKGLTEKDIFSPSAQRAADIKQKQAEEDIMYQKYGKTRVKSAGIKGTPGEFKKQWIIDPKLKDSFFPEEVLDPNFMRTVLDLPTEESWSPNYPKTYRDFYPTPSSRYGWSQMGPIAQAGGISKLAGGGMVGIRKPHAIAPTGGPMHQGLRSLYIDDMDY